MYVKYLNQTSFTKLVKIKNIICLKFIFSIFIEEEVKIE